LHSDDFSIERPSAVDSTVMLRSHAYRPLLVVRLQQREHYFRAAAQIMNRSGIFTLIRPWDFGAMPGVMAMLEQHWRDVGIVEEKAA
jgi:hypothetical protein